MRNKWVADASPLILLGKAECLHLLLALSDRLIIPKSVAHEVDEGPTNDPARHWLSTEGSHLIVPDAPIFPSLLAWDLGGGETAVLAWAQQNSGFEAILDDRAARKCARVLDIPVRGTLGVVLAAKQHKLIPAAKPICEKLVANGLLIDQALIRVGLELVGE